MNGGLINISYNRLDTGVLVIAHGSRDHKWVSLIEECVEQAAAGLPICTGLPICIGYLELVPGKSIEDGLRYFEHMGVRSIVVVPLFITAGSTHIEEIRYMLGLTSKPSFETDVEPIPTTLHIHWCPPMESHPVILQLLADRISEISKYPAEEILFFTGHGSEVPGFQERWEQLLRDLAVYFKARFQFKAVSYGTFHPDTIPSRMRALSSKHRVLVIPLFLSEGYFTKTFLPGKLGELPCEYTGKTYLPHPLVAEWIEESVRRALAQAK